MNMGILEKYCFRKLMCNDDLYILRLRSSILHAFSSLEMEKNEECIGYRIDTGTCVRDIKSKNFEIKEERKKKKKKDGESVQLIEERIERARRDGECRIEEKRFEPFD